MASAVLASGLPTGLSGWARLLLLPATAGTAASDGQRWPLPLLVLPVLLLVVLLVPAGTTKRRAPPSAKDHGSTRPGFESSRLAHIRPVNSKLSGPQPFSMGSALAARRGGVHSGRV